MKRLVLISVLFLSLSEVSADPVMPQDTPTDTMACEIFRKRQDWYNAARQTEARWGLPISHQLAFLTEDWELKEGKIPSKWKPDWTRPARSDPGIAPGFFDATWDQYRTQTGNRSASKNRIDDALDFMGWYFATLGPPEGISPYDPTAQYILWRHGPDIYRAGEWRQNLWLSSQANKFGSRARLFMRDLEDCHDGREKTLSQRVWAAANPMKWHKR